MITYKEVTKRSKPTIWSIRQYCFGTLSHFKTKYSIPIYLSFMYIPYFLTDFIVKEGSWELIIVVKWGSLKLKFFKIFRHLDQNLSQIWASGAKNCHVFYKIFDFGMKNIILKTGSWKLDFPSTWSRELNLASTGGLVNSRRGAKRGPSGPHIHIYTTFQRQCPPPPVAIALLCGCSTA